MSFQRKLSALLTAFSAAVLAFGQVTWTGPGSGFAVPANWTGTFVNDGTANVTFSGTVSPEPIVDVATSINSLTYASGTSPFTLGGTSTLTIQSSLTHNSGSLQTISAPLALGSPFTFSGSGSQTFLRLDGALTSSGGGTGGFTASNGIYIELRGAWNVGGTVTLQGFGTVIEFLNGTRTLTNNFVNNANLSFNTGANTTITGVISGTGALTVHSPLTLSASNTYTGATSIGATTLTVNAVNALPVTSVPTFSTTNSRLQLNQDQTLAGLTDFGSHGAIAIASGRKLTFSSASDVTVGAKLEGEGSLAKAGAGTLTLNATNTYAGATTINGGTLSIGSDANLGTAPATPTPGALVLDGGTLQVSSGFTLNANRGIAVGSSGATLSVPSLTTLSYGGVIAGTGPFNKTGPGTLVLSGTNTFTGAIAVNMGQLQIGSDANLGAATNSLSLFGTLHASESLTLNSARNISLQSTGSGFAPFGGTTLTVPGVISGTGRLTKYNNGTLVLSGANTYSGGTRLWVGTVAISSDSNLGATSGALTFEGGTLQITSGLTSARSVSLLAEGGTIDTTGSAVTLSGVISGVGGLTKAGTGTLTLSGANTFSGTTTISAGTLTIGNSSALSGSTLNYGAAGGTLSFGGQVGVFLGGLSGDKPLALTNASSGAVTLQVGNNNTSTSYSGVLSGSGALTKVGTGTLTLSGANTYSGLTSIWRGTLLLGANGVLPGGNVVMNPTSGTATLDLNGTSQSIGTLRIAGSNSTVSNVNIGTGGTLTLGDNLTYDAANNPGGATISGGTLALSGSRTFNIGDSTSGVPELTISSAISGAGATLTKTGAGTLVLTNANTYGPTIISDGTVRAWANGALPAGADVTLNGPAEFRSSILDLGSFSAAIGGLSLGGVTNSEARVFIGSEGTLTLGNLVTFRELNNPMGARIEGGTLQLGADRIFNIGDSTNAFADLTVASTIAGSGFKLIKNGAGTLRLDGVNTYTGTTTINEGRLQLGIAGALPAGGNVILQPFFSQSAMLDLSGTAQSIGNLTLAGGSGNVTPTVALAGGTLTIDGSVTYDATSHPGSAQISGGTVNLPSGTHTFSVGDSNLTPTELQISASISGAGGVTKTGAGTLLLSSFASTFTGPIALQAGVLAFSSLGSGTGTIAISAGSTLPQPTLRFTGSSPASVNRPIEIAGAGGATLEASGFGDVTFSGTMTGTGTGAKTVTLHSNSGSVGRLSGVISDGSAPLGFVKTGFGTWQLSGANTFTGGVTIGNGTLASGGATALGSGPVTIHASGGANLATLDLAGTTLSVGSLTFGGTGGSSFASNNVVLGSGGTLALGGNVTFVGSTDLATAPLGSAISWMSPFNTSSPIGSASVALGGATRTFNVGDSINAPADLSVLANITGSATDGVIKTGTGTLLLAGSNTYGGSTTVQTGTLLLASGTSLNSDSTIQSGPVGKGTLVLQAGTTLATGTVFASFGSFQDDVWLRNDVTISNNVTLGRHASHGVLELAGTVTLNPGTDLATRIHLGAEEPVFLTGTLQGPATGSGALVFDSTVPSGRGVVVLAGTTQSNVTSILAEGSAVLFGSNSAIPSAGSVQANNGYVGVVSDGESAPSVPLLLSRITDKAGFSGTFGFDTNIDYASYPFTFTSNAEAPFNFSGFGLNFTIGSASAAILAGPFVAPASGYQFGNGGGVLFVESNLTEAKNVSVISQTTIPDNALTAVFQGSNTYTGSFTIENSAAILDSAGALPAGRQITLAANGYVGYTEMFTPALTFGAFLDRIAANPAPSAILGLDSHSYLSGYTGGASLGYGRLVTEPLNLGGRAPIYLGTTTAAFIGGRVVAPGENRTLSLAAIGEQAFLGMMSPLRHGDVNSLVLGTAQTVHTPGLIILNGDNTYGGGTTLLNSTVLFEGGSRVAPNGAIVAGPFGTGTLTVGTGVNAQLASFGYSDDAVLHNNVALGGTLRIGLPDSFFGEETAGLAAAAYDSYYGLILNGIVSGLGGLEVFQDLALNGANTFSGGVTLRQGTVTLGTNTALGTGPLTVSPFYDHGYPAPVGLNVTKPLTIANNLVLAPGTDEFYFGGRGALTINGSVALNGPVYLETGNYPVTINGNVTGAFARLQVEGHAPLTLNGTGNTYGGGTEVEYGKLIFGSVAAIPAQPVVGLSADWDGYIGLATPPANLQTGFIDRFSKFSTWGTIGFDTPPTSSSPNVFTGPISLTGFNSDVRLGSASRAVLSGTITPQGSTYYFGGGGGLLEVNSGLGNGPNGAMRDLQLYSDVDAMLTLRLGSPVDGSGNPLGNSYTGGTTVGYASGLIFKAGAMPATGSLYVYGNSYLGTEETDAAKVADFLNRISTGFSGYPIIGFDSFSGEYALGSGFTWPTVESVPVLLGSAFLGTATSANISAALPLGSGQTTYRFAGFKGGQLTVSSVLANDGSTARSVQIGDANNPATYRSPGDVTGLMSSVTLSGNNTYSGGTTLSAGQLLLGHASALGIGTLTVNSGYYYDDLLLPNVALGAATSGLTIANNITLNSPLTLVGPNNFTLSGSISDSSLAVLAVSSGGYYEQMLQKVGSNTVTLSGNNSGFSGGIYIAQGGITFATANSVGTGPVLLGGPLGPTATFNADMTVNGISGDHVDDRLNIGAGKTLTINQTQDATYAGQFTGSGIGLVFAGPYPSEPSQLRLTSGSSYTGSNTINAGIVIVAENNNALGASSNAVNLSGGTLGLASGITLANPLTLTSGVLAGLGSFSPTGAVGIGTGVTLSPGRQQETGTLAFGAGGLNLLSGGKYVWSFGDALNANGGWDQINVAGPVTISVSSPTNPFTFKIEPAALDLIGGVANFNPTIDSSWPVLTSATSITGFTAGSFSIDPSALAGHTGIGSFFFTVNALPGGGNALTLNFTAVPEPSTYALLGLGAVAVLMISRRRRR